MKVTVLRLLLAGWLVAHGGGAVLACSLALVDVNVVPMDREVVIAGQTVLVEGEGIATIGPTATTPTAECGTVVPGKGRYLIPGLIDAHVHVESLAFAEAFGVKSAPISFADVLALYPANGVTAVRVMSGAPDILAFRDRAAKGSVPVPRLVVASPMLSGSPPILPAPVTRLVESPEQARAAVREFVRSGYDLIKIRENLKADVFEAVTAEARRAAILVDGHVTRGTRLGVSGLIAGGQSGFAHLDEIARAMDADNGRRRDEIAALLKSRNVWISSTMSVLQSAVDQIGDYERMAARPQARFLHPLLTQTFWTRAQNPYLKAGVDRDFFLGLLKETKAALVLLTARGVRIVAGTDALNPMIIPGISLHEELRLMVDAGLTPFQALRTATVNPAVIMRRLANAGVIAAGKDADLVLIGANPLNDIGATAQIEGVVLRGRWFDRATLERRLEDVAAVYRKP